jgi:uncharacterized membrane protein YvlD (DUF360 family)
MRFLIELAIRTLVFGVALTFATRRVSGVKVEPRNALPAVALVFAILNALLYGLIASTISVVTLWTLALIAPFLANALLLWLTDKLFKPLRIEGLKPLLVASFIITIAHFLLRLVDRVI